MILIVPVQSRSCAAELFRLSGGSDYFDRCLIDPPLSRLIDRLMMKLILTAAARMVKCARL
jgi:hypothetical protein